MGITGFTFFNTFSTKQTKSLLRLPFGCCVFRCPSPDLSRPCALRMNIRIVNELPQTGAPGLSLPMGFAAMLLPVGIAATGLVRRRRR
jgi:hypothetical protein